MPGERLSPLEREEISRGCSRGRSFAAIARRIGRPTSTVSREVHRNGGRGAYRCWFAGLNGAQRSKRPRQRKLIADPKLGRAVQGMLEEEMSPEQIAGRLRFLHPDDPSWWVSHETIYQSLFLQGRGGLRKELTEALRTGRAKRRPRGRRAPGQQGGLIKNAVSISERPSEAEDRAVPGYWEGDLIIGKNQGSQIGTLVERTTRFTVLLHLPDNRKAESVNEALRQTVQQLPAFLAKSITWDRGSELSGHADFTVDTGVQIYFCDPRSPWQRGTNENTNGLLRQYFPKSTDLSVHTIDDLERVALKLNNRPRKALGFMTPAEKFAELIAMTA
jgi:transposase, IS30 family